MLPFVAQRDPTEPPMRPLYALASCLLLTTAACAAETEPEADSLESPLASKKSPGVDVVAKAVSRSVGTPTYGYDPRGLFLTVTASIEDRALRARHPAFDGLERPFALVTVDDHGAPRTVRVELPYAHTRRAGYYGERTIDVYEATQRLDTLAVERGAAVGLDTNVGTIWAQDPGDDFPITR